MLPPYTKAEAGIHPSIHHAAHSPPPPLFLVVPVSPFLLLTPYLPITIKTRALAPHSSIFKRKPGMSRSPWESFNSWRNVVGLFPKVLPGFVTRRCSLFQYFYSYLICGPAVLVLWATITVSLHIWRRNYRVANWARWEFVANWASQYAGITTSIPKQYRSMAERKLTGQTRGKGTIKKQKNGALNRHSTL